MYAIAAVMVLCGFVGCVVCVWYLPRIKPQNSDDAKLADAARQCRLFCASALSLCLFLIVAGSVLARSGPSGDIATALLLGSALAGIVSALFWSFSSTLVVPIAARVPPPLSSAPANAVPVSPATMPWPFKVSSDDGEATTAETATIGSSAASMAAVSLMLAVAASLTSTKHGYGKLAGHLAIMAFVIYFVSLPGMSFSLAICIEKLKLHRASEVLRHWKGARFAYVSFVLVLIVFVGVLCAHLMYGAPSKRLPELPAAQAGSSDWVGTSNSPNP